MGTKKLPRSCFFSVAGPHCNTLWDELDDAGFSNVTGAEGPDPAGQVWITPPGGQKTQISPPGNNPDQAYDLTSEIQLVAQAYAH